jgi:regulator of PEP synthase PpsR (kinase-PPPase family)
LEKAEIVLLGVSRTFKTPLSVYLAFKGWLVANVPIVLGIELPEVVFDLPPERVFGLMTNPRRLVVLRSVRERHFGGGTGDYADLNYVQHELMYAQQIFKQQPKWPIVDVTNKPIEEIAFEIVSIMRK